MVSNTWQWPALDLESANPPEQLSLDRGVWGKLHGARSDYRWIAATPAFLAEHAEIAREAVLGPEDEPRRAVYWRASETVCHAVVSYPSQARDASMRHGFVEKQFLAWRRPPAVPAALGALVLLPRIFESSDELWWPHRGDSELRAADSALQLSSESVSVEHDELDLTIERGISEVEERYSEDELTDLVASLLAGQRGIPAGPALASLEPAALAALLLALPRSIADRLSLAGAFLSSRGRSEQATSWNLVAGAPWEPSGPAPSEDQRRDAARRVRALLARRPESLTRSDEPAGTSRTSVDPDDEVEIALWGPSSAGKTVLIAQLYLFIEGTRSGFDWEIFPDRTSVDLIQKRREQMHRNNFFPHATVVGTKESIVYNFINRAKGIRASMVVEDRAGDDFESLQDEVRERLKAARGLVLLFDPHRQATQLELEVAKTLEEVHVSRDDGDKDHRPIAVCISKADTLIETARDYEQAIHDGESFVRAKVDDALVRTLERFCTNYRLFPVSAAGLKRLHGVIEPTVFFDETLTPRLSRGGTPLNLMMPFSWVLDEVTAS